MTDYRYERITPNHYRDLVYISMSAFNINPGENYYRLKNQTARFGETHLGYIAYHNETNEPAAFYGVYSYPFEQNGSRSYVVQSGDTMTHASHTGKGLFITLAKMTYDLAKEKGAKMVFGFPNDNSYPGFVRKLDWTHQGNINIYKIKVKTLPLLKLSKKVPVFKPIYSFYVSIIDLFYHKQLCEIQNSVIENNIAGVSHDKDFVFYKSFNGSKVLQFNSVKTWIKQDGFLFVGDIERKAQTNLKKFLRKLKQYAFLTGSDIIQLGFSPQSFWDTIFQNQFNPEKGAAFAFLKFDNNCPIENFQYTQADIDTF